MQVVVVVPGSAVASVCVAKRLTREICGVPLLTRTLATAQRAGANEILLIWPQSMPLDLAADFLQSPQLRKKGTIKLVQVQRFDPKARSSWENLQGHLDERFIWLPWNWVTYKRALANLPESESTNWTAPKWVSKTSAISGVIPRPQIGPVPEGIAVASDASAVAAERFLVAHSGKVLDGIHTSFNRWLCRPAVRWLTHTSVTPNAVTLGGVVIAILSAMAFARGNYWSYVAGSLLFYMAGLFDEMDGMLARIKFSDSPFGTWFEGFADGISYLLLFGSVMIGLYRQHGSRELWVGGVLLVGTVLSLVVISLQRKRAARADRPHEYLGNFYQKLEADSSNWISRMVRQVHAFQKRGVMIIYIAIFTVLGGLSVVFYLATLASHLTWIGVLYFDRRFFKSATPAISFRKIQASQEAS
jgi:phosphatidylglycerophosphate synthase